MAIKFKKSIVPGAIPLTTDIAVGEIAINLADRIIYSKHPTEGIVDLSSGDVQGPSSIINWKVKSQDYSAALNDGILADTDSIGSFNLTLPNEPMLGGRVSFAPFYPTLDTNPVTLISNTYPIGGIDSPVLINQNRALEFIFIDTIYGWAIIDKGETAIIKSPVEKIWKIVDTAYLAENGDALISDTITNGSFTIQAPSSPEIGWAISIAPLNNPGYSIESLFISPNGSEIMGSADPYELLTDDRSIELVYVGGSIGWAVLERGSTTIIGGIGGGSSLGSIKALRVPFTYSSGTFEIGQLTDNATVVACTIKVDTVFGGSPVLTVGNSSTNNGITSAGDVDLTSTGLYYNRALFDSLLDGTINGYLSGASGTGAGTILIEYYETE